MYNVAMFYANALHANLVQLYTSVFLINQQMKRILESLGLGDAVICKFRDENVSMTKLYIIACSVINSESPRILIIVDNTFCCERPGER